MEAYEQLELEFSGWNGLDSAGMVACSSGTAALHLAFEAMRLPLGSEVLCPDFTMIACPRAITLAGLTPVFVDCGDDLLIDSGLLSQAVGDRVKAVMAVHVYGRVCSYSVAEFAINHRLKVIEDCAECHGSGKPQFADAACWSFFRNKIVAGEEGGAVWFRDPSYAEIARSLRCLGFTAAHDFRHAPRGHNYRMSNLHARFILNGADGLHCVRENIKRRRQIEGWYDRSCPDQWKMPRRDAPWVYDLRIPGMDSTTQSRIVGKLLQCGIAARHGFHPMSRQEEYKDARMIARDRVQGTASGLASREVIYLPLHPTATENDCRRAFDVIRSMI